MSHAPEESNNLSKGKQALRRAYARAVALRQERTIQPWKLEQRANFLELLQAEGVSTLLEIGSGTGEDAAFFAAEGLEVTATDLTPENVAACRQLGLHALVMDACDLRFPAASFDSAFSLNCLLHLPKADFPRALANIRSVLKPGALIFLGQYGGRDSEGIYEDDDYEPKRFFSFFSDAALKDAITPYFEINSFKRIELDEPDLHFQSLFLRRPPS